MRRIKHAFAYAICALALAMVACAPGANGVRQAIINATGVVTAGYKTLGQVDQVTQMRIRDQLKADPMSAAIAMQEHQRRYDIAKKALDAAKDAVEIANAAIPAIEKGLSKDKRPSDYIADLESVSLAVTKALAEMGVLP